MLVFIHFLVLVVDDFFGGAQTDFDRRNSILKAYHWTPQPCISKVVHRVQQTIPFNSCATVMVALMSRQVVTIDSVDLLYV